MRRCQAAYQRDLTQLDLGRRGRCRRPPHHRRFCHRPAYHPPRTQQRLLVSLLSAVEGFGVSLENAAYPVRVVGKFGKRVDGEGDGSVVFVGDAVPVEDDGLEQGQVTFLAQLAELLAAQALEGDVEGAGVERATVSGLLDRDRPFEGLDLLTNERHKLRGRRV